jgi:carbamoyltransferase
MPVRPEDAPLTQAHMDIAASIQAVTEDAVVALARGLAREFPQRDLCLAGGVALNCVANGKLLREGVFDRIWIQPAAGDAGGALGAALAAYHCLGNGARRLNGAADAMDGAYLGPSFSDLETQQR